MATPLQSSAIVHLTGSELVDQQNKPEEIDPNHILRSDAKSLRKQSRHLREASKSLRKDNAVLAERINTTVRDYYEFIARL